MITKDMCRGLWYLRESANFIIQWLNLRSIVNSLRLYAILKVLIPSVPIPLFPIPLPPSPFFSNTLPDMVKLGHRYEVCPYYLTKELQASSEVVFMPYNYFSRP